MPPDIAVIDSGINPDHPHVGNVIGGHGYTLDATGKAAQHACFMDGIGHGTAIAGILREKAPASNLYAIKIFETSLTASAGVLISALEWAISEKFRIIHLSLGIQAETCCERITDLCRTAYENDLVIIAAARGPQDAVYPAALETVIGVFWDRECNRDQISYQPGENAEFGAHGWPRALPGMPQEMNFRGNSFAVAHVTGTIARLAEPYPYAGPLYLKNKLCQLAVRKQQHPN